MHNNNEREIANIVSNAMSFFNNPLSEQGLKTWVRYLSRYDSDQVSKAFDAHLLNPDSGMFKPTPAHIEALLQGTSSDRSSRAWSAVNEAIQHPGVYCSVVFDDPIIHLVIEDLGGWAKFGTVTFEDMKYIENHFKTAYKGYVSRPDKPVPPKRLAGISEIDTQEGKKVQQPIFIGDVEKCKRIYLGGRSEPRLAITDSKNVVLEIAEKLGVDLKENNLVEFRR